MNLLTARSLDFFYQMATTETTGTPSDAGVLRRWNALLDIMLQTSGPRSDLDFESPSDNHSECME